MSALRLVSGAAGRSAVGAGAATRWRRLTALLPARQLSTAAGAAAAKAAPKAGTKAPRAVQQPPLQTTADVQRFLSERAALKAKRMANPPRARPDAERERRAALQAQGLVTVAARWRPRAEAAADTRQQLLVPATLATRDRDGRRTYLSIAVPRRQLMQEMAKNVVHCRVYRVQVTGVPGHEGKTLTYNAVCTRINQPPMTDGPQNAEFVLFEPYHPTRVVVPVQFEGVEDCIGRKHGGLVFFRTDRVSAWWCGDHNIPSKFVVDVLHADVGTTFHLSDLHWPKGLRPAHRYNHLLCSVRGSTLKDIDEEQKQADEAAAAAGGAVGAAAGGAAAPAAGGAAPKADAKAGGDDKKADKK